MLEVQQFLRAHSLAVLTEHFAIKAKRHGHHSNLCLLNYSQIDSPKTHPITRECRGLILDEADSWRVVSHPYNRFFNAGEGGADTIDWTTARCYDKLDGSLCTLYFYDGQWHVATRGTPDASGQVNGASITFKELFWQTFKKLDYELPKDSNCCYMFELMTPFNRVVVRHTNNQLHLHGARNILSGQELDPIAVATDNGWQPVKIYPLSSLDEILSAAQVLEPMESEGYIICDREFNRVKVKSPAYVAISHLKDGFSTRRMIEILIANESSEFLLYFPEWTGLHDQIKSRLEALALEAEALYQDHHHIESQKDFAIAVKSHRLSAIAFQLRKGQISSTIEGLRSCSIQKLEELLQMKYLDLGN